ncbi:alpha-glucosidase [Martelella lutilitoris]|uniref:Alpha-glucosidase n=1 Tax=Martelella lutilitoris TaxID=2583532 RepID=A0A7T7HLP9_9HYPH|nr:alpha-glucosidase family protein [Martelella lutilitoris]QQM31526.1 alpha-glucosidase [Martelella lutilitoris]
MTDEKSENGAWWRGGVIYQIYPRSFQDTTGDGIGNLPGITRRLAYVAELGVDAVWLSPFFTSPMADMGYDVSDYLDVDPMFGTLDDFRALVAEAHRLGLKVIIDQVLSHTSDQHAWFKESRKSKVNDKADWFVWADAKPDGTAPNNWLSIFGGPAWEWDGTRKQYYMHNFLASQPDLNFHCAAVQDALLETVRFWLELGVDGFRLDTVNYYFCDEKLRDNPAVDGELGPAGLDAPDVNPYGFQQHIYDKTRPENIAFLQRFRALLDEYGDRTSVGEVGDGARSLKTVAAYTSGNDKLHMCYTFDFLGPNFSPAHIRNCVENFFATVKDGWVCWAFSNHDVDRHASRFARTEAEREPVAKLAISLLATLRGSICLYQGEELGLPQAEIAFEDLQDPYGIRFWPSFKGRDGCRTPMPWSNVAPHAGFTTADRPWLPVPREHLPLSVFEQAPEPDTVYNHYRAVLSFRAEHDALFDGDIAFMETDNEDVLMFTREKDGKTLLFVYNFADTPQSVPLQIALEHVDSLDLPGMTGVLNGAHVDLGAFDGFCAKL